jgi:hypothetical protein
VNINGSVHNVIFVATQHDSVYAFDADVSPCQTLWYANLLDATHGGAANESSVCWNDVGADNGDIQFEVGVTGTPVIDPITGTLYVVSKSETGGCQIGISPTFFQRLHAIDLATSSEKFNAPKTINASVAGTGAGSSGGLVQFNPQSENQRPGLTLLKGVSIAGSFEDLVYVTWASHEDASPYHGWVIGYNATNVQQQLQLFNATPNGSDGGIWMSGAAPAADANNNLFLATGNGTFDANTGGADYGDSMLRFATTTSLSVSDYFTPLNQASLNSNDSDLGAGGVVLVPDQTTGLPHLLISGGKQGIIYLVNRDNMGTFSLATDNVVQKFQANQGLFSTAAFWQNTMYIPGSGEGTCDQLNAYTFNPATDLFNTTPVSSSHCYPFPSPTPSISSSGSSNGIVWATDVSCYATNGSSCSGPAVLFAEDATNVSNHLWDSTQAANNRDQAGNAVKFAVPTVANGKVYIGTRTELDVYGLLP